MSARLEPLGTHAQAIGLPRTVVHYVDSETFGGVEQVVSMLLSAVDRDRWTPMLYVHENPGIARLVSDARALGVVCRTMPRPRNAADGRAWLAFRRQLVLDRAAVFHAHLGWPLGCRIGIGAAKLAAVPCVVATSHLFYSLDEVRWSTIKQYAQAMAIDRYIAVSGELSRRLERDLGVPQAKLRVVHNGIPVLRTPPKTDAALRATLLEGVDRPIVLTAARLHEQKGHDYLLEAALRVPEALFVLAGDGPERERLESKACSLGIQDRVRFLGQRNDVGALLAASDLFVLPSLYEGLPLSVLEAMAACRPVVATSVGGTAEAIVDGESGILVRPGDPSSLAIAIRGLLAEPDLASSLARTGRERVGECFSVEAMARGVESVYREALSA